MAWTKHFTRVPSAPPIPYQEGGGGEGQATVNSIVGNPLPQVYAGHPNRIQRYYQYEDMARDCDIRAALDTIADFCTQSEEQSDQPFIIHFAEDTTESQVSLVTKSLEKWVKINEFRSRLWYIFRACLQNGDSFFLRDPETMEWLWMDSFSVEYVQVDEADGKTPVSYFVRGLDYGKEQKFATGRADPSQYRNPYGIGVGFGARPGAPASGQSASTFQMAGAGKDMRSMRFGAGTSELSVVDAGHVIHLSLSMGMDHNWPFGESILEPIFKVFKQKELLEDSILIYRVQRAPERRVFYIDTGEMPPAKAKAHLEAVKNEIHQRRVPSQSSGGGGMLDASYSPLSINDDYFLSQSSAGRGSKIETLPGGDNIGEITDLTYFSKKMARGLRIPTSYLDLGEDGGGGGAAYNDGKLGAAMIQEYRFNKYCMRWQSLLAPKFDDEFKTYLDQTGVSIDPEQFDLRFNEPQNFTKYRQIEIDMARIGAYMQVSGVKSLAERFKQERYLGLTEADQMRNEKLWKEENAEKLKSATGSGPEDDGQADLGAVGLRPGRDFGLDGSMPNDMPEDDLGGEEPPASPAPNSGSAPGAPPPAGEPPA